MSDGSGCTLDIRLAHFRAVKRVYSAEKSGPERFGHVHFDGQNSPDSVVSGKLWLNSYEVPLNTENDGLGDGGLVREPAHSKRFPYLFNVKFQHR